MSDSKPKVQTFMRRPIDCTPEMLNEFAKVVLASGEVPIENLQRGIPAAEMLFFSVVDNKIIGVSCARHQNALFHRHIFERAGVPQMYNPHSLEMCWLSVLPEYRGMGAWSGIFKIRQKFMQYRPGHAITRVENERVADLERYGYFEVGEHFHIDTSDDLIRLVVKDHDPVFDPKKKMKYVR